MKKLAIVTITISFCTPVFAYLDPGSGSAILSAIIGAFVAAGIAIKSYWYKLKKLFNFKRKKEEADGPKI